MSTGSRPDDEALHQKKRLVLLALLLLLLLTAAGALLLSRPASPASVAAVSPTVPAPFITPGAPEPLATTPAAGLSTGEAVTFTPRPASPTPTATAGQPTAPTQRATVIRPASTMESAGEENQAGATASVTPDDKAMVSETPPAGPGASTRTPSVTPTTTGRDEGPTGGAEATTAALTRTPAATPSSAGEDEIPAGGAEATPRALTRTPAATTTPAFTRATPAAQEETAGGEPAVPVPADAAAESEPEIEGPAGSEAEDFEPPLSPLAPPPQAMPVTGRLIRPAHPAAPAAVLVVALLAAGLVALKQSRGTGK